MATEFRPYDGNAIIRVSDYGDTRHIDYREVVFCPKCGAHYVVVARAIDRLEYKGSVTCCNQQIPIERDWPPPTAPEGCLAVEDCDDDS